MKTKYLEEDEKTIQKTKKYDVFQYVESNRTIDKNHVNKLVNAIQDKNMLHLNPIIVNELKQVIDGQHRLEAAKQLGYYIYYIVDNNVGETEISRLNAVKKNWKPIDYVNFWATKNKLGFRELKKVLDEYPLFGLSTIKALVGGGSKNGLHDISEGYIDIDEIESAKEVLNLCNWLGNHCKFYYANKFVFAVRLFHSSEGFNIDTFKEKISMQPRSLVPCINTKQYAEMLLEIYNYKLSLNRLEIKL